MTRWLDNDRPAPAPPDEREELGARLTRWLDNDRPAPTPPDDWEARAVLLTRWLDTAMRPDLHPAPVEYDLAPTMACMPAELDDVPPLTAGSESADEKSNAAHTILDMASKAILELCSGDGKTEDKGGDKDKDKEPKLLTEFAKHFADAANLIRKSKEGLSLISEASAAEVEYGGYAEDGPGKDVWPYTTGNKVYVPKARTDPVVAMSDFLFELNNGIRAPQFRQLRDEVQKGSKGSMDAQTYAYKTVEQEVEGMLRMGKVWVEARQALGGGEKLDKYDADFYLGEYEAFKKGEKSQDDLIEDVLKRKYSAGDSAGQTVEEFYMVQYDDLSGGK